MLLRLPFRIATGVDNVLGRYCTDSNQGRVISESACSNEYVPGGSDEVYTISFELVL